MIIRSEIDSDISTINSLICEAFLNHPHSDNKEQCIVDALREQKALIVSLVATKKEVVIGHIAFSKVNVDGFDVDYYGIGPLSVSPNWQHKGIDTQLL